MCSNLLSAPVLTAVAFCAPIVLTERSIAALRVSLPNRARFMVSTQPESASCRGRHAVRPASRLPHIPPPPPPASSPICCPQTRCHSPHRCPRRSAVCPLVSETSPRFEPTYL